MDTQKTALVTGATSGIGKAAVIALAQAGYNVVFCGRRAEKLAETEAECGGADVLGVAADVTHEAAVADLFAAAKAKFGRIDVVFNNAGLSSPAAGIDETRLADFQAAVNLNLTGAFLVAREAFRYMRAQDPQGGRIINNGSISAHVPRPNAVPYNTTKSAINGLTKTISLEGRLYNIACGQIDIGNTGTDMTAAMASGKLQANFETTPEPTFDVKHVAESIVYMAGLPLDTNVQTLTIMATNMPFVGRG